AALLAAGTAGAYFPAQGLPGPCTTEHRLRRTSRIARRPSPARRGRLAPDVRHAPVSGTHQRLIRLHKLGHLHPVCNLTQISLLHRTSELDDVIQGPTTSDNFSPRPSRSGEGRG